MITPAATLKPNRARLVLCITLRTQILLEVGTPVGPRTLAALLAGGNSGTFTRTTAGRRLDHFYSYSHRVLFRYVLLKEADYTVL